MKRNAFRAIVLTLLLAGFITTNAQLHYRDLDMVRYRWDRAPRYAPQLADRLILDNWDKPKMTTQQDEFLNYVGNDVKGESWKRSALVLALKGRMRREPGPAVRPGKAGKPYVGVDAVDDLETYMDFIRHNAAQRPSLRAMQGIKMFKSHPTIIRAPFSGGVRGSDGGDGVSGSGRGGGVSGSGRGSGIQRLHALRPLTLKTIRTYNRRSFVNPGAVYPRANQHNPSLEWTGLGR